VKFNDLKVGMCIVMKYKFMNRSKFIDRSKGIWESVGKVIEIRGDRAIIKQYDGEENVVFRKSWFSKPPMGDEETFPYDVVEITESEYLTWKI
jgi:hypothetical protein